MSNSCNLYIDQSAGISETEYATAVRGVPGIPGKPGYLKVRFYNIRKNTLSQVQVIHGTSVWLSWTDLATTNVAKC